MKSLFKDINGNVSSKRVFAALCIVAGIVLGFVKSDASLMWPCFTTGAALLGVSVLEKPKGDLNG